MPMSERFWALYPEAAQAIFNDLANHLNPAGDHSQGEGLAAVAADSKKSAASIGYTVKNGVAVINISGTITRKTYFSFWSGEAITQGQDSIAASLEAAVQDRSVKAVLLNINSPGGIVPGTKELADRIAAMAKIKPMAAYADGLMASAAMWLGAATGRVLAPATATVGSVGVLMVHADYSRLNEKWGVSISYITGGRLKAAGNENQPLSEEARELFQHQVSQLHEIFKADVVSGLGLTAPAEKWAEGQTMVALDAKSVGLVTHIVRDLESAITMLSQEATMDYQTFAAKHPELLAEIKTKAATEALEQAAAQNQSAIGDTQTAMLSMVKAVAGEEAHARISKLVAAGIKPEQLEALASMIEPPSATAVSKEEASRAAILASLQKATPATVSGDLPETSAKSKLIADAERRAANS